MKKIYIIPMLLLAFISFSNENKYISEWTGTKTIEKVENDKKLKVTIVKKIISNEKYIENEIKTSISDVENLIDLSKYDTKESTVDINMVFDKTKEQIEKKCDIKINDVEIKELSEKCIKEIVDKLEK